MDAILYAVSMPQFLGNYKILFKTVYKINKALCMLILNVKDNDSVCNCGVC